MFTSVVDCGFLENLGLPNVVIPQSYATTFNTTAEIVCETGYVLDDGGLVKHATCGENGTWVLDGAICIREYIDSQWYIIIKDISEYDSDTFFSFAVVDCGSLDVVGLANAVFPLVYNSTYNSSVDMTCETGYVLDDNSIIKQATCNENGTWVTDSSICIRKGDFFLFNILTLTCHKVWCS